MKILIEDWGRSQHPIRDKKKKKGKSNEMGKLITDGNVPNKNVSTKNVHKNVYTSFIHNGPKLEKKKKAVTIFKKFCTISLGKRVRFCYPESISAIP